MAANGAGTRMLSTRALDSKRKSCGKEEAEGPAILSHSEAISHAHTDRSTGRDGPLAVPERPWDPGAASPPRGGALRWECSRSERCFCLGPRGAHPKVSGRLTTTASGGLWTVGEGETGGRSDATSHGNELTLGALASGSRRWASGLPWCVLLSWKGVGQWARWKARRSRGRGCSTAPRQVERPDNQRGGGEGLTTQSGYVPDLS